MGKIRNVYRILVEKPEKELVDPGSRTIFELM
jgi:hypothetical protein